MSLVSRLILRWSWVILFAWFGLQQLTDPSSWTAFLPVWTGYLPVPAEMFVQLNGWFEVCAALLLAMGYATRPVAALLAIHLMGIAVVAGGAIGIRDGVLAMVGVALALSKPDPWTLDEWMKKQKQTAVTE